MKKESEVVTSYVTEENLIRPGRIAQIAGPTLLSDTCNTNLKAAGPN
jgi:hypothetical protein